MPSPRLRSLVLVLVALSRRSISGWCQASASARERERARASDSKYLSLGDGIRELLEIVLNLTALVPLFLQLLIIERKQQTTFIRTKSTEVMAREEGRGRERDTYGFFLGDIAPRKRIAVLLDLLLERSKLLDFFILLLELIDPFSNLRQQLNTSTETRVTPRAHSRVDSRTHPSHRAAVRRRRTDFLVFRSARIWSSFSLTRLMFSRRRPSCVPSKKNYAASIQQRVNRVGNEYYHRQCTKYLVLVSRRAIGEVLSTSILHQDGTSVQIERSRRLRSIDQAVGHTHTHTHKMMHSSRPKDTGY